MGRVRPPSGAGDTSSRRCRLPGGLSSYRHLRRYCRKSRRRSVRELIAPSRRREEHGNDRSWVALAKAVAPGRCVGEARHHDPGWIVQRAPDVLTTSVQIASPSESWISGRRSTTVGFTVSEYQNMQQCGNAQPLRSACAGKRRLDVHDHALGAAVPRLVGASEAWPVEPSRRHQVVFGGGRLEPEFREIRNSSGLWWPAPTPRADRPTWAKFANGTEIRGAMSPRLQLFQPQDFARAVSVNPEAGKGGGLQASWRHGPVRP